MSESLDSINDDLLSSVCAQAARLAASQHIPPQLVRVQAGDIAVEIAWPEARQFDGAADDVPMPRPEARHSTTDGRLRYVCAPTTGRFYHCPAPGAPPYVTVGDRVTVGQQVGVLETMQLMLPVTAESCGIVECIVAGNAARVEYGERLMALVNEENIR